MRYTCIINNFEIFMLGGICGCFVTYMYTQADQKKIHTQAYKKAIQDCKLKCELACEQKYKQAYKDALHRLKQTYNKAFHEAIDYRAKKKFTRKVCRTCSCSMSSR